MSVHMVMSVHVGEPVLVWHAASGLKEPTLFSLLPDHEPFFFYLLSWSPIHFPSFAPLPLCLSWQLSFSLFLGATSACGPPRKSWVAAQYSNVASFTCCSVNHYSTTVWWLQSHSLWLGMSKLCEVNRGGTTAKPHENIKTHPWFSWYDEGSILLNVQPILGYSGKERLETYQLYVFFLSANNIFLHSQTIKDIKYKTGVWECRLLTFCCTAG